MYATIYITGFVLANYSKRNLINLENLCALHVHNNLENSKNLSVIHFHYQNLAQNVKLKQRYNQNLDQILK
jgi:hypothetical protein